MSPRTIGAGVKARQKASTGEGVVTLVDIVTVDGTNLYWSDQAGTFPVVLGTGPTAFYSAHVKSAGDFECSRANKSDSGNLTVQNLSGTSITREIGSVLSVHEMEGAMVVVRFYDQLEEDVLDQYVGSLTEADADDQQASFRIVQLLDPNQADIADDPYSETCTLRFKELRCGSTSPNPTCSKRFADCTAVERFNGVPAVPPGNTQTSSLVQLGNAVDGLGGGGGGEPNPLSPVELRGL